MRVLLVGTPGARARLRADVNGAGIEIAGEFETLAAARAGSIRADAILLANRDRVRLKPDTTDTEVRLKPDTTDTEVRLKPNTTDTEVRLEPDATGNAAGDFSSAVSGLSRTGDEEDDWIDQPLTPREIDVLELLAEGLPNKSIAERLGISDQTVKFHVASISGKLGASNRTDAVRRALRRGLISL